MPIAPWRPAMLGALVLAVAARAPAYAQSPGAAAWRDDDWAIVDGRVRWAVAHGLDTMRVGDAVARMGETFVGTPYRPGALEGPPPERLVINLRELDCVTFVEHVLVLVRFSREEGVAALADSATGRRRYEAHLRALRYRDGVLDGYASRLHYFSEWLQQAERDGWLVPVPLPGAREEREPPDFMTRHAALYPALADAAVAAAIVDVERRLASGPGRQVLPKEAVAGVATLIRDGDVIAIAAATPGLDVVHTGFALWRGGALHLMHAPLVGKSVEVSELPLADRLQGLPSQRGITVARPTLAPAVMPAGAVPPSR